MQYSLRSRRSRSLSLLFATLWALTLGFAAPAFAQEESPQGGDASAAAEETNGGQGASRDAFRCDFFLHVVRDDDGNVKKQYKGDELILRRVEQCLSKDVLADTIVDKRLPGTGGPAPLLFLGIAAVALGAVAGIVLLRRL